MPTCRTCHAAGYVLSLKKVSCSHDENYYDPDHECHMGLHQDIRWKKDANE